MEIVSRICFSRYSNLEDNEDLHSYGLIVRMKNVTKSLPRFYQCREHRGRSVARHNPLSETSVCCRFPRRLPCMGSCPSDAISSQPENDRYYCSFPDCFVRQRADKTLERHGFPYFKFLSRGTRLKRIPLPKYVKSSAAY